MTTATFDTLQFAKNLGEGGFFNKEQAEALARAMAAEDARRRAADAEREKELVTKGDLKDLKFDLLKWAVALLVGFYVAISVTNTGSMYVTLKLLLPSVL